MTEVRVIARVTMDDMFPTASWSTAFPKFVWAIDAEDVNKLDREIELVDKDDHDKRVAELEAEVERQEAMRRDAIAEYKAELAEAMSLFKLVMDEHPGKEKDGNAPGHCHQIPGIWDSDNGKKAGKPCAWCAVWNNAHKFLARHGGRS